MSKKEFLDGISHPRRRELAEMIFAKASREEMLEAGYGEVNVTEMCTKIAADVDGKYEPSCSMCESIKNVVKKVTKKKDAK